MHSIFINNSLTIEPNPMKPRLNAAVQWWRALRQRYPAKICRMLLRILLCSLYRPLLRSIQRILNLARKFGAAAFKNAGYLRALHVTAQRALEFQCNTRAWLDNGGITRLSTSKRSKEARAITTSPCKPLRSVCWNQKSGQWLITLPACAKT